MIDIGKLSDYGGIGGLVAVVSWWTRYSILKEQIRREEKRKELEVVTPIVTSQHFIRSVKDHAGRIAELEISIDRHERYFEEHDKRLVAAERFIVNAKHSPEA